jgi:hypothetical protein
MTSIKDRIAALNASKGSPASSPAPAPKIVTPKSVSLTPKSSGEGGGGGIAAKIAALKSSPGGGGGVPMIIPLNKDASQGIARRISAMQSQSLGIILSSLQGYVISYFDILMSQIAPPRHRPPQTMFHAMTVQHFR